MNALNKKLLIGFGILFAAGVNLINAYMLIFGAG